jgi:hypothetical protein
MKKYALKLAAGLFLMIPILMNAQSPIDKIFEKYNGQEGFTSVNISKDMFQMFSSMGDTKDTSTLEMKKIMDQLTGLKIITCNQDTLKQAKATAFYNEAVTAFPKSEYKELMTVNEEGSSYRFLTKQDATGKIKEMVMLSKEKHEIVVLSLTGSIDLATLSKLSKRMNIHGFENLGKMKDKHMSNDKK